MRPLQCRVGAVRPFHNTPQMLSGVAHAGMLDSAVQVGRSCFVTSLVYHSGAREVITFLFVVSAFHNAHLQFSRRDSPSECAEKI